MSLARNLSLSGRMFPFLMFIRTFMESDLEIGFKEPKWWRKSRNLIPTFRIAAAHKNQRAGKTGPRLEELKLLEVQKRLNATEGSYCDCWHDRLLYQYY